MPFVAPLPPDHDLETQELAEFFNETLGSCPNSVLTMQRRPAIALFGYLNRWNDSMATTLEEGAEESGRQWLSEDGWQRGKHR